MEILYKTRPTLIDFETFVALVEAVPNVNLHIYSTLLEFEIFQEFLQELAEKLGKKEIKGFEEIWKEQVDSLLKEDGFQKEDRYLFQMVGNGLGYLDLNMQIENLNLAMLQTEEALKIAKEVQKVRGKLYQTLGVTAGMFLTLLII